MIKQYLRLWRGRKEIRESDTPIGTRLAIKMGIELPPAKKANPDGLRLHRMDFKKEGARWRLTCQTCGDSFFETEKSLFDRVIEHSKEALNG